MCALRCHVHLFVHRLVAERQLIENFMTVLWGLTQTAVVLLQHFQEPGTSHDPHSTNNPQRHRFMVSLSLWSTCFCSWLCIGTFQ